jgi:hypothetical protein
MSASMPDKLKKKLEDAKQAVDRRDDQLEQAAEKADPHVHEAKKRLAEASRSDGRERHRS